MGAYSKMWGSLIGGVIGFGVAYLGLPEAWQSPEAVGALTTIASMIATAIAPKNT